MKVSCSNCGYEDSIEPQKTPLCPECDTNCKIVSRLDSGMHIEKLNTYRSTLPDGYCELFDELVSGGKSPDVAIAALRYLTENETQRELANEFGITEVSIRNVADEVSACDMFFSQYDDFDVGLFEVFTMFEYKTLQQWAKGMDVPVNGQSSRADIAEQLAIQDNPEEHIELLNRIEEALEREGWLSQEDVKELVG